MGTKILIFVCWLAIAENLVKTENIVTKSGLTDNISAESVSRLYKNVPVGVYASAVPYASYSFHVPTVLATKNIPVKEETILVQNTNGYLKDSYGNQFLQSPQSLAYRTTFPRQSIQLQNLPAHLRQPLVSPSSQFKQSAPHFFSPTQYNVQNIQGVPQTTLSRYTVQPLGYGNMQSLAPNSIFFSQYEPRGQQQPTGNNIYYNSVSGDNNNKLQNDHRYQHSHETPHANYHNNDKNPSIQQTAQSDKSQQLQQVPKQTTITTLSNGNKIAVNLVTKPPVPLLDLNLLEPLTFANPLVPQVQHYLPRIHEATYHKLPNVNLEEVKKHQMEFVVQNTKTYDSEDKAKKNPKEETYNINSHEDKQIRPTPTVSVHGSHNEGPEFSYEINSPNHKETYTEQKVNYNKETGSDPKTYNYEIKTESKPIHYSYEKNTQKKPVIVSYEHHIEKAPVQYTYEEQTQKEPIHYSYVKTSKEPKQKVHHTTNNQSPKHLVYTIKPDEQANFEQNKVSHHHPRENSEESQENKRNNEDNYNNEGQKNYGHHVHYIDSPQSTPLLKPEHRQVHYYHTTNQQDPNIVKQHHTPQSGVHLHQNEAPIQHEQEYFQPINPEYEEEIKILPPHKVHDKIRVDPNQHIQTTRNPPPRPQNHPVNYDFSRSHYSSAPIIKGKPKQKNNDEPSEEEIEAVEAEMFKDQEKNEENFEKSYRDAAYGFPAYDAPREEFENSEIYNPESYGASQYHSEYNIDKSPLQQYEAEGDDFPKFTRSNYKDERDKMHEDYFLDYAVSKPTSLRDSFRSKENYYKMFKNNKPIYYGNHDDDKKKYEKYTYIPTYEYHIPEHKQKQRFTKQKSRPEYEYDYSVEEPRDASAHETQPLHRYKSKTQFVEPQFQYGFEPISIPQLLDSELSAMASNDNPKSEKRGTRKKIYKENVYFKKTSTKGGKKISR